MNFSKELIEVFRRFVMQRYYEACDNLEREMKHRQRQRYDASPHYRLSVEAKIIVALRERDKWLGFTQEFRGQTFKITMIERIFDNAGQDDLHNRTFVKTSRSAVFTLKPRKNTFEHESPALEAFLKYREERMKEENDE